MSFDALAWAGKQRPGKASEKLVLIALADRHNPEAGLAYPSIKWLSEFCDLDRKTVIAALASLAVKGFIRDSGQRYGATKQVKGYLLSLQTVPKTGQSRKRNSSTFSGKESQKRDTEPVREPVKKKKKRAHGLPDDWEPRPFTAGSKSAGIVESWTQDEHDTALEHFRAHHLKKGDQFRDWQAAWSTWVLNSRKFGRAANGIRTHGTSIRELAEAVAARQ